MVYTKKREWFSCAVYTVLSLLVLFTAFNVSNIESMTQTFNTTLEQGYAHSLVSIEVLVNIRSLTVILSIVSHALKQIHPEATETVKVVKAKSVQTVKTEEPHVQEAQTPKEPTPIHKNFDRVKDYLISHPKATAREVGRALGMSPPTAAKWVKKIRSA